MCLRNVLNATVRRILRLIINCAYIAVFFLKSAFPDALHDISINAIQNTIIYLYQNEPKTFDILLGSIVECCSKCKRNQIIELMEHDTYDLSEEQTQVIFNTLKDEGLQYGDVIHIIADDEQYGRFVFDGARFQPIDRLKVLDTYRWISLQSLMD